MSDECEVICLPCIAIYYAGACIAESAPVIGQAVCGGIELIGSCCSFFCSVASEVPSVDIGSVASAVGNNAPAAMEMVGRGASSLNVSEVTVTLGNSASSAVSSLGQTGGLNGVSSLAQSGLSSGANVVGDLTSRVSVPNPSTVSSLVQPSGLNGVSSLAQSGLSSGANVVGDLTSRVSLPNSSTVSSLVQPGGLRGVSSLAQSGLSAAGNTASSLGSNTASAFNGMTLGGNGHNGGGSSHGSTTVVFVPDMSGLLYASGRGGTRRQKGSEDKNYEESNREYKPIGGENIPMAHAVVIERPTTYGNRASSYTQAPSAPPYMRAQTRDSSESYKISQYTRSSSDTALRELYDLAGRSGDLVDGVMSLEIVFASTPNKISIREISFDHEGQICINRILAGDRRAQDKDAGRVSEIYEHAAKLVELYNALPKDGRPSKVDPIYGYIFTADEQSVKAVKQLASGEQEIRKFTSLQTDVVEVLFDSLEEIDRENEHMGSSSFVNRYSKVNDISGKTSPALP